MSPPRNTDLNTYIKAPWQKAPRCTGNRKDRQGRNKVEVSLPPYLFTEIRDEATKRKISFNRCLVEILEAGICPE